MNIIDIIILAVCGICVAYGIYKGFVHSLLTLACGLLSLLLAFCFAPQLADFISTQTGVSSALINYTDAQSRVGEQSLSFQEVSRLDENTLDRILENVKLPETFENVLEKNLQTQSFAKDGLTNVNQYVSNTIVGIAVNILSFILCYVVIHLLLTIVVNILNHVFRFPLLKHLDWLAGGVLGLLKGTLLLYVIFLALPLINTIVSIDGLTELTENSTLAPIFQSNGLFSRVIASL